MNPYVSLVGWLVDRLDGWAVCFKMEGSYTLNAPIGALVILCTYHYKIIDILWQAIVDYV